MMLTTRIVIVLKVIMSWSLNDRRFASLTLLDMGNLRNKLLVNYWMP